MLNFSDKNNNNSENPANKDRSLDSLFGQGGNESTFSFDIVGFLMKLLKYWYLFVITIALALGLAFIKNKSWKPAYKTATTILIEDSKSGLRNDFMSGYSLSKSLTNQMILYNSYDFISKVVDGLNLTNEIYIKQRFKNIILYKNAPIEIVSNFISEQTYGKEFKIKGLDEDTYLVSFAGDERIPAFEQKGKYGVPIQHSLFFVEIKKTDYMVESDYELYFKFFSKRQLVASYGSRLSSRLLREQSTVIEISMSGEVAQRDLDFLNLLNEQFFADNLSRKNAVADRSISFIDRQIAIIRDSIDSSEAKLNSYQISSGMYSTDKSASKSKVLDELDQKRAELRLRKEYINYLTNYLNQRENEVLTDPSAMGIHNPQLTAYINQYNLIQTEMKTLGSESPIYKRNLIAIEDLRKSMRESIATMNSTMKIQEDDISKRYGKAVSDLAALPQQERKLLTYERDFKINDTYYTYLLQRRTESQIQKASNAPDNLVVDVPRVMSVTNGDQPKNTYLLYLFIGFLIPLIFVACKEFLFKFTIQTREEVEKITRVPLLGAIERSKKKEDLVVKKYPRSSFTEGFRNLRSRMEYLVKKEDSIVMLLTSTEPKDGKTFISLNLASIYQLGGRKVVLVDFDLRRPATSKTLGMDQNKGLSNYLIGQVGLDEVIVTHPEYEFDVLPAGVIPPNPSELIRDSKTKELIVELQKRYDYVILDCSPVGLVSDAHFLSRLVDIVLYVVRNEKTNKNFLKYTMAELREDGVSNISVIYNDIDPQNTYGSSRYYGKSSYYLKHGNYYHNE